MDSLVTNARKGNHNNCGGEKVWEGKGAPSSDQSCSAASFTFFFEDERTEGNRGEIDLGVIRAHAVGDRWWRNY